MATVSRRGFAGGVLGALTAWLPTLNRREPLFPEVPHYFDWDYRGHPFTTADPRYAHSFCSLGPDAL